MGHESDDNVSTSRPRNLRPTHCARLTDSGARRRAPCVVSEADGREEHWLSWIGRPLCLTPAGEFRARVGCEANGSDNPRAGPSAPTRPVGHDEASATASPLSSEIKFAISRNDKPICRCVAPVARILKGALAMGRRKAHSRGTVRCRTIAVSRAQSRRRAKGRG
jgi:hypothetical protein